MIGRKQILIENTKKKAGHLREGCAPPDDDDDDDVDQDYVVCYCHNNC